LENLDGGGGGGDDNDDDNDWTLVGLGKVLEKI
jgi:hypothetical protein